MHHHPSCYNPLGRIYRVFAVFYWELLLRILIKLCLGQLPGGYVWPVWSLQKLFKLCWIPWHPILFHTKLQYVWGSTPIGYVPWVKYDCSIVFMIPYDSTDGSLIYANQCWWSLMIWKQACVPFDLMYDSPWSVKNPSSRCKSSFQRFPFLWFPKRWRLNSQLVDLQSSAALDRFGPLSMIRTAMKGGGPAVT